MGEVAARVSSRAMRDLAVKRLGFTEAQVDTLLEESREDLQRFKRQVLIQWRNRSTLPTRQVGTPCPSER